MSTIWTFVPGFSGVVDKKLYVKLGLSLLLCSFLLSACGPNSPLSSNTETTAQTASAAAPTATIAPMSPPGASDRPPMSGQRGTVYNKDGLPALQPARGMNVENLFAENITDTNQRFQRVENAVTELRKELDSVMPSIVRLVAVEKDMSELVKQLQTLLRNEPPTEQTPATMMPAMGAPQAMMPDASGTERPRPAMADQATAPPQQAVPVSQSATRAQPAQKAQQISGKNTVKKLRIGEHPGKTRMVLDVNGPAQYSYDLDNNENLLVIELPDSGWAGKQSWSSSKAPLMSSYTVQPSGNGSRVIIQLKKPVRVIYEDVLKPNGTPDYRIVLDLAAQ